ERRRVPDKPAVLTATVRAAVRAAAEAAPDLLLLAGGKSMGGRMTSQAAAEGLLEGALDGVRGLVFFGFPLHPPKQPGTKRAEHLFKVQVPMLFLQGTRDALAGLKLLRTICMVIGVWSTMHEVETVDYCFYVMVQKLSSIYE